MGDNTDYKHSPRALDRALRKAAEKWWNLCLFLKLLVFLLGTGAVLFSAHYSTASANGIVSSITPVILIILLFLSDWSRWRSNSIRDRWQALHRELDALESFGWPLSRARLSDLLTEVSLELRKELSEIEVEEEYFASIQPVGPLKAIENVQESAWWAKHLSKRAGTWYLSATIILILLSIIVALLGITTVKNFDILLVIGTVATSTIMLIFSLDLINLPLKYLKYHNQAAEIEKRAEILLGFEKIELVEAIKLMNDYHLAHDCAPIIPNWTWRLMQQDLNEMWKTYRRRG